MNSCTKNTSFALKLSVRNSPLNPFVITICALFAGTLMVIVFERLSARERAALNMHPVPIRYRWIRGCAIVFVTAMIFVFFHWASLEQGCLETAEVQPSGIGRYWRLAYHLTLFAFLIVATAIDFDCYMIPDAITLPGMIIGVVGAGVIGEAQICHLWVDWTLAVPQLRGPLIPDWYDPHRNLHGIAWSLSGLVAGAGLTWLARQISSRVLGQEAMGTGDITLMAMIGSFLGWQAVTLVFLLAPLTGLIVGLFIRTLSGKTYLPYGPWISIAAVIVLFSWSQLWAQTRMIFSDWLSVAVLGGIGVCGFVLLLGLVRLYKSIPTRTRAK
jgi:leader peptidase (prepilin peptidase)/N-methyltransferase